MHAANDGLNVGKSESRFQRQRDLEFDESWGVAPGSQ